jgi:hypothetical protein
MPSWHLQMAEPLSEKTLVALVTNHFQCLSKKCCYCTRSACARPDMFVSVRDGSWRVIVVTSKPKLPRKKTHYSMLVVVLIRSFLVAALRALNRPPTDSLGLNSTAPTYDFSLCVQWTRFQPRHMALSSYVNGLVHPPRRLNPCLKFLLTCNKDGNGERDTLT